MAYLSIHANLSEWTTFGGPSKIKAIAINNLPIVAAHHSIPTLFHGTFVRAERSKLRQENLPGTAEFELTSCSPPTYEKWLRKWLGHHKISIDLHVTIELIHTYLLTSWNHNKKSLAFGPLDEYHYVPVQLTKGGQPPISQDQRFLLSFRGFQDHPQVPLPTNNLAESMLDEAPLNLENLAP